MNDYTEPSELDVLKARLDNEPYSFFNFTREQKDNVDVLRYATQYVPGAISDTNGVLTPEEYSTLLKKDGSLLKYIPDEVGKESFYEDALINGGFHAYKYIDESFMTPRRYLQVLDGSNVMILRGIRNSIQSGDYINTYSESKTGHTTPQDNVLGTLKMIRLGEAIETYHPDIHVLMLLDLSVLELKSNIRIKLNGGDLNIKAEELPDFSL